MYYVYILKLHSQKYYIGFSEDLRLRFIEHQQGHVASTKTDRPVTLVFYSAFSSKKKALNFEAYLKTGSGFAFRNKHLV